MENNVLLSLPDDVLHHILSLLPPVALPSVLFVCSRFSKLVQHHLVPTIHLFSLTRDGRQFVSASMSPVAHYSPNQNWSPSTRQTLHVTADGHTGYPTFRNWYSLVSLGRFIYVIGSNNVPHLNFRYDRWTKTTSSMAHFPTYGYSIAAAINGKIYANGCPGEDYGRCPIGEYDPAADEWRIITHGPTFHAVAIGAGGVFYRLKRDFAGSMFGYDPGAREWVGGMPKQIMSNGRVMCACGTPAGHVYMVSCHWFDGKPVESRFLRFSRWEGSGEEWIQLEAPVLLQGHEFMSLVALRDEMVVAIVNKLAGRKEWIGKYVLAYNVADGRWGQRRDLPPEFDSETNLVSTHY